MVKLDSLYIGTKRAPQEVLSLSFIRDYLFDNRLTTGYRIPAAVIEAVLVLCEYQLQIPAPRLITASAPCIAGPTRGTRSPAPRYVRTEVITAIIAIVEPVSIKLRLNNNFLTYFTTELRVTT